MLSLPSTPPTTAKRTRVPPGGAKATRDPKLSGPQPGASSSEDSGVQPNVAAAPPGQPVPTHSFVSNVLLHTSRLTVVPAMLCPRSEGWGWGMGVGRGVTNTSARPPRGIQLHNGAIVERM